MCLKHFDQDIYYKSKTYELCYMKVKFLFSCLVKIIKGILVWPNDL